MLEEEKLNEDNEMFEHFRFVVDKGQSLLRIDKYLTQKIENASRSKVQEAADAGFILVNEKPVKSNYKVKPADVITVYMNEPPREIEIIPENIPLNIVYEDEDLIVINKPPDLVVHPAFGHYSGTLVNALAYHLSGQTEFDKNDVRPGLVHRIDKDTSGIIVVAKTNDAKNKLGKQFFDRTMNRRYQALAWGTFENETGTITGHIGRNLRDRKIMQVFPDGETGKHAVTHYKVLESLGYVTLLECKLETGRTHQIRAHMQYIGHPIFNDEDYGGHLILKGTTFSKYKQFVQNCFKVLPRQALHAKSLGFVHPRTGKELFFDSELPADMSQAIERWRGYVNNRKEFEN